MSWRSRSFISTVLYSPMQKTDISRRRIPWILWEKSLTLLHFRVTILFFGIRMPSRGMCSSERESAGNAGPQAWIALAVVKENLRQGSFDGGRFRFWFNCHEKMDWLKRVGGNFFGGPFSQRNFLKYFDKSYNTDTGPENFIIPPIGSSHLQ
jgi:hypothetical protein